MAQNIALNIILNGVPQAVSNIEELEIKLKQAKLELTQIAIGSDAFKKLSAEIQQAESKLKTLQKSAEGKDLEAKLGDLARLGGAIGASFGAATAAFALFGEESEDATKALAQAQNALVIALAAREAAEGAVVIKTIANDLATKALAASTAATDKVTKAFYATLAANPYAAILTAVGLVVGALVLFINKTDDATKAQKEFNDSINKDISKETTNLQILADRVRNVNLTLETRKKAIEDLRAIAPNYFKTITDEQLLQSNLKDAIKDVTAALVQQSEARARQTRVEQTASEILRVQDELTAATNAATQAQKAYNLTIEQARFQGQAAGVAQATSYNAVAAAQSRVKELEKQLNALKNKRLTDLNAIKKIEGDIDKILGGEEKKEEKITEQKKEQVITNTKLLAQQNKLNDALEEFQAILSFESISEPTIITDQEKILSNLQGIFDKIKNVAPDINKELESIFKIETTQFPDPFKNIVTNTTKFITALKEVPVEFKDIQQVFSDLKLEGDLTNFTDEQKQDLTSYFNVIKQGANGLKTAFETVNKDIKVSDAEVAEIFQRGITAREKVLERVKNGEITQAQARLEVERLLLVEVGKKLKIDEKVLEGLTKSNEKQTEIFNAELKRLGINQEIAKSILTGVVALTDFSQEVNKQGDIITQNNEKIKTQVLEIKKAIESLNAVQVGELLQSIGFDFQKSLTYVVTNAEMLGKDIATALLKGTTQIPIDFDKMTRKQLKNLENTLKIAMMELEAYGIDAEAIFQKLFSDIEKSAKEKLVASILEGIQQFQAVMNSLSQVTSMYFSSQFDLLEKRYKRLQDTIVGDSEASNQKRLEAEKAYQKEREALEKKAAKTALRISLAQALANTAEAITKLSAITGGVGAVIAGGAIAAFNAVQVGIIANQLATIDSYKRGGRIKSMAGGGFITGPSHEYGGVKFQGGGVELEGNESVINRVSTINYMGLLNQINQAGGGRPIGPGFDDSRIVEAIAKQRNTPIRAYVVESDITAKQETARRLEKLSQI